MICEKYRPDLKVKKFYFIKGRHLKPGELSKTGIYGLESKSGIILRASLDPEIAKIHYDESSRTLCELHISK